MRITSRLIDSLYTEAMLLADEARSYFDDAGRDERADARAVRAGRLRLRIAQGDDPDHAHRRLAADPARDRIAARSRCAKAAAPNAGSAMPRTAIRRWSTSLPEAAQRLISASADLYARVKRIDEGSLETRRAAKPGARVDGPARTRARAAARRSRRAQPRFRRGILLGQQIDKLGGGANPVDRRRCPGPIPRCPARPWLAPIRRSRTSSLSRSPCRRGCPGSSPASTIEARR